MRRIAISVAAVSLLAALSGPGRRRGAAARRAGGRPRGHRPLDAGAHGAGPVARPHAAHAAGEARRWRGRVRGTVVTGASWAKGGAVVKATGKVYFEMGGGAWICTGTVITDGRSGYSVVLTAGHCAVDETTGAFATNWLFIPSFDTSPTYTCASTTYGCWTAVSLVAPTKFATAGGFTTTATLQRLGVRRRRRSARRAASSTRRSDRSRCPSRPPRRASRPTRSATPRPASTTAATSRTAPGRSPRTRTTATPRGDSGVT